MSLLSKIRLESGDKWQDVRTDHKTDETIGTAHLVVVCWNSFSTIDTVTSTDAHACVCTCACVDRHPDLSCRLRAPIPTCWLTYCLPVRIICRRKMASLSYLLYQLQGFFRAVYVYMFRIQAYTFSAYVVSIYILFTYCWSFSMRFQLTFFNIACG
jgi:hypothetical protein